ncbi:Hypothetical protein, putative [Bodo saltans]|uniref:Uncharacterized protein n=1 Tax=Bodo saltans TaxID=75058 RepID=A0A0S4JIE5_BODSA|nr:Hypothetical protein, putative [Bodo saltans]|eukprot:CUG89006.1 Hypothetical protein, putative [Bodo saltans]
MMSIKLPWLLRCPTVRVAWLFLVVWVATGLDIGCNNITSPSLLLNVTTAPSVRILNCTRRIAVNVTCGMDKDHLMRVEVVGGTTVPVFNLVSCSISGVLSFSFATLSIRNVTMPTGPANALDLQSNPLFSTLSVFTLSITVVDSQLQWTSGYLISCNGPSSNLRDLNVSIANSSLESRIADASSGGVLFVSVANIQSIGVVIMSCSIFVAQTSNTAKGMIRLGTDSGDAISIAMIDSVMSVLSEGFGNCNCVMLTYSQNIGYLSRTSVLVSGSNFTAKSQVGFAVVTIPFQRQLSLTDSRFDIVRCQLGVTLNVIDLSTDLGSPIASPFSCVAISLENIIVTVLGVNMSVVRNITGALRSVSSSGTSILGFIGLTYFSTNVSMSTVEVTRSTLTIEEVGAELVLPYQPVAVLGFAFATVSYSLHFSAAASFVKSNITILNSSITALRSVVDDAVLVASPGVQSGILFWSLTAVALSGPTVQTHISVKTTGITAATLAYPSQSPASLKVWCVVAAISNVAPNTAFAADQSSYLAFSGQLSLNFTSLDVNNSLFEITGTTMQLTPPLYSQLATPVTAAQQRVLFGMAAMSNVVNTTVLVTRSRFCNITDSLTTTVTYDTTACLAWVSLAPTSTIDNLLISSCRTLMELHACYK